MAWPPWRRSPGPVTSDPIDINRVIADGLRDPASARTAIKLLERERKEIDRQRKLLNRQYRQLTLGRAKGIARARVSNPAINDYMLAQSMAHANDQGEGTTRRDAALAALDERHRAVGDGLRRLRGGTS